jgi:hypothetical protein
MAAGALVPAGRPGQGGQRADDHQDDAVGHACRRLAEPGARQANGIKAESTDVSPVLNQAPISSRGWPGAPT